MKVFIVWSGEYSDRHIVQVFKNLDDARDFVDVYNRTRGQWDDRAYVGNLERGTDVLNKAQATKVINERADYDPDDD